MKATLTANDGRKIRYSVDKAMFGNAYRLTGLKVNEANGSKSGLPTGISDGPGCGSADFRLAALYYGQEIADQLIAIEKAQA